MELERTEKHNFCQHGFLKSDQWKFLAGETSTYILEVFPFRMADGYLTLSSYERHGWVKQWKHKHS